MPIFGENGVKIQNFEKSKKAPLDILEIHVVSKFGPIPMKIMAGSWPEHTHPYTHDGLFSTLVHYYTNILLLRLPKYLPT